MSLGLGYLGRPPGAVLGGITQARFGGRTVNDWNADDYEIFAPQRQHAAQDLLAAVLKRDARVISDLGCGSELDAVAL